MAEAGEGAEEIIVDEEDPGAVLDSKLRKRGSIVVKEVKEAVERKRATCMERQEVVKINNK